MIDVVDVKYNESGMHTLRVTVGGRSEEDIKSQDAKYLAAESAQENGFNANGRRQYREYSAGRFDYFLECEFYDKLEEKQ